MVDLHLDRPASEEAQDRFQRYGFAKRVASLVSTPNNPSALVIGLYGKWGSGKTSILNFVERELPAEAIAVRFNPWLYTDWNDLLTSLFSHIAKAVGVSLKKKHQRIGKALAEYADAIGMVTGLIGVKGDALKTLGNKMSAETIQQIKARVDSIIVEADRNIVIFIDDIDRLDVDEIQQIFKLVKLVGDFPRTSYILAFDEEMVSAALSPKYGDGSRTAGMAFLEKIIQLPLVIPVASASAVRKFALEQLIGVLNAHGVEFEQNGERDFFSAYDRHLLPITTNPRVASRYANAANFALPLLQGEVNLRDLLLIEALKVYYPQLYVAVRNNSQLFLAYDKGRSISSNNRHGDRARRKADIEAMIQTESPRSGTDVIELLTELFPQLEDVFGNMAFGGREASTEWFKSKRICSGKYFDRYFSYVVADGEVSDAHLNAILSHLSNETPRQFANRLEQEFAPDIFLDVLQKIRFRNESLPHDQLLKLCQSFAMLGAFLPASSDEIFVFTAQGQAAGFIAAAIHDLPADEQFNFTQNILEIADPLEYAVELLRVISKDKRRDVYSESNVFSEHDFKDLRRILVRRFIQAAQIQRSIFGIMTAYKTGWMLTYWQQEGSLHQTTFMTEQLDEIVQKFDGREISFLDLFCGYIISLIPVHREYRANFHASDYHRMTELIDADRFNDKLHKKYGDLTHLLSASDKALNSSGRDRVLTDEMMIGMFQWHHRQVVESGLV